MCAISEAKLFAMGFALAFGIGQTVLFYTNIFPIIFMPFSIIIFTAIEFLHGYMVGLGLIMIIGASNILHGPMPFIEDNMSISTSSGDNPYYQDNRSFLIYITIMASVMLFSMGFLLSIRGLYNYVSFAKTEDQDENREEKQFGNQEEKQFGNREEKQFGNQEEKDGDKLTSVRSEL